MDTNNALAFTTIKEQLAGHALSEAAKAKCLVLQPAASAAEAASRLGDTTQAKRIIEHVGTPPCADMWELARAMGHIGIGAMLSVDRIWHVHGFLVSCRRMKTYLKRAEDLEAEVASYGASISDLSELETEIERCIRGGEVDDKATPLLADLRRKMLAAGEQIKMKLDAILRKNKALFSESFVAMRGGRYTLPVKRECKFEVAGTLVEMSNTGGTCFIEPASVRKLQDGLNELAVEEDAEVRRVLYTLTAQIEDYLPLIRMNAEAMETLDFLFAKAKLSLAMQASPVQVAEARDIRLFDARHPLLEAAKAVPLDFAIGECFAGVVITGPNTGGKTVALKTVGLLSLMAQSGLHIPADAKSNVCMHDAVLCDIGDGQSITENLSTFSAHMTNILQILQTADKNSLVLLDELGSGTDPAEGMGIAVSVLEELCAIGCLFVATTHYPEIKAYAAQTEGLVNARMAFDRESLMPLYRLEIGAAGESCALYIAERLGMPPHMLGRARLAAYGGTEIATGRTKADVSGALFAAEPKAVEAEAEPAPTPHRLRFQIGDSVVVYPRREIGIVYAQANERGEVGVQIRKKKMLVSHKRIKLKVAAAELYPEDYDFSIVFDSVENRKARHVMEKRHEAGNTVIIEEGKQL